MMESALPAVLPFDSIGASVSSAEPPAALALYAALQAGVDKLSHGVALLDVNGNSPFANASARWLWSQLGWQASADAAPLRLPANWAQALQQVCIKGRREFLHVAGPKGATLTAVLTPLAPPHGHLAFVVFGRDELCGSVELQMFALRHQLTHAETVVLRKLCVGLNAGAIALEHGVARTTVLTQIAAIRAKTQSASVRSLLDALARMPPVRGLLSATPSH